MKVYLAAPFGWQAEMRAIRDQLTARGVVVTSRWIDRGPGPGADHRQLNDDPARFAADAVEDIRDVSAADWMISFTQGAVAARGGRHVEFGLGLAMGKRMLLVGEREHVFHALDVVEHYPDWSSLVDALWAPVDLPERVAT